MYCYRPPDLTELQNHTIRTIRRTQKEIAVLIARNPKAFEHRGPPRKRDMTTVDSVAEELAGNLLTDHYIGDIEVYGEEDLALDPANPADTGPSLAGVDKLVAILDMVDGTDLLIRGFANWCSAIVFFHPRAEKIIGAFVGIPVQVRFGRDVRGEWTNPLPPDIYFALDGSPPGRLPSKVGLGVQPLIGPSKVDNLADASVCVFGQTAGSLLALLNCQRFQEILKAASNERRKPDFRFYNLSGNPMMARLANGEKVDAIIQIVGQKPHDFVAGAYIAKRAGASLQDLSGNEIDYSELARTLLEPAAKTSERTYILASTRTLGDQLRECFTGISPH